MYTHRSIAAVLLLCTLACGSVTGSERSRANAARVTVTGTSSVPLMLITSTRFLTSVTIEGEQQIGLIAADTAHLQLPIDRTIAFDGSDRFFVLIANPDSTATASIEMRVEVDGRQVFRQSATMRDASLHFTYFVY